MPPDAQSLHAQPVSPLLLFSLYPIQTSAPVLCMVRLTLLLFLPTNILDGKLGPWAAIKSSHPNPYLCTALVGSEGVRVFGSCVSDPPPSQISLFFISRKFKEGGERHTGPQGLKDHLCPL